MSEPRRLTRLLPIEADDPLLGLTLRAALECVLRGDYVRGADLFLDSAALSAARVDRVLWFDLGVQLRAMLSDAVVANVDAVPPRDVQVSA